MHIKRGIAVSPGVAIGPALVLDTEGVVIAHRNVPPEGVEGEVRRLHVALAAAAEDAKDRGRVLAQRLGTGVGGILFAHSSFYDDPAIRRDVESFIRGYQYTAEYAVSRSIRNIVKAIENMPADSLLARNRADLLDMEKQVLGRLLGVTPQGQLPLSAEPVIVLAHDLTPSETAGLDPHSVHGFATESGGPTSHTAIMADALGIPAVVGLGRFLSDVSGGDRVIVDGAQGLLIIDPDEATLARYTAVRQAQVAASVGDGAAAMRDVAAVTKDGVAVRLLGNIEFPSEARPCLEFGGEGVGLYRTEFLYVNKVTDPAEEEHFESYKAVLAELGGRPMVIRTLDIGADKFSGASELLAGEKNPFLGLRSVRLCLKNLDLFKTQLRAILRASVLGDVRVMFPMVSTVGELRQCKSLLNDVREELDEAGVKFNPDVPVGTMIEVPSAALMADTLAREVDFFSIGTNDLVQYTLAADRNNEMVAGLYNPADPAVLRLIKMVVDAATKRGTDVNVCGEMSGEPLFVPLLLGLGLRQLSATPRKLPDIKRTIRNLTVADAERVAAEALRLETAQEVGRYLREQMRRIRPDSAD